MSLDFGLEGKTALVTGAGQGVGHGIAMMLAEAGATVVVNDYAAPRAAAVVAEITDAGGSAVAAAFDVTDRDLVHDTVNSLGGVDILVNNAGNQGIESGIGQLQLFHETSPGDWMKYFDVNTFGVMNCVHAALPRMINGQWGRIITIVSDAGRHGEPQMAAYGAAKAAAAGFMRCIAREVGRYGITVNSISLGTMKVPSSERLWNDPDRAELQKAMLKSYVIRRPGDAADPAWLVATLASPRASWITGQTYPVNGGYTFAL